LKGVVGFADDGPASRPVITDEPRKPATLTIVYNANTFVGAGGDIAISPDNIDTNQFHLMIQGDGTGASRPVMSAKGRDDSFWRFDLSRGPVGVDVSSATRRTAC
jgi:hypothetical protein